MELVNSDEPYYGVQALFNADVHKVCPDLAPREDWAVISSKRIAHVPYVGLEAAEAPEETIAATVSPLGIDEVVDEK